MPEKFGQKLLFIVINAIFSLVVLLVLLSITSSGKKASVDYVDKADGVIQTDLNEYKSINEADHKKLNNEIKEGFKELKEDQKANRDMIIDVIKSSK